MNPIENLQREIQALQARNRDLQRRIDKLRRHDQFLTDNQEAIQAWMNLHAQEVATTDTPCASFWLGADMVLDVQGARTESAAGTKTCTTKTVFYRDEDGYNTRHQVPHGYRIVRFVRASKSETGLDQLFLEATD